uniref:GAF domain-containing protein n=1 Tax=Timema genevievae TaxID=629358 RepID=A0A7R9PK22_TIMGE|nr:unnamed protein product [Timema genevievae]
MAIKPAGSIPRRQQLDLLDEGELFMELIRDVANELDIDVLCHKILVNVGVLTSADRGSLFLARGPREHRYLIAKLFDVTVDTELEDAVRKAKAEEIHIPFGVGIAGMVAQSKQLINIKDAYQAYCSIKSDSCRSHDLTYEYVTVDLITVVAVR